MNIYNEEEIISIAEACRAAAMILNELAERLKPGISAHKLDVLAGELMEKLKVRSAPRLLDNFPGNVCISINSIVAHGVPQRKSLKYGDMLNIDVAVEKNGFYGDVGRSFSLNYSNTFSNNIIDCAEDSLLKAISVCRQGTPLNKIGKTIYKNARSRGFTVVRNLCSHGVGKCLHEHPVNILNYDNEEQKEILKPGMILAIEPYISSGATRAVESDDGWSLTTHDKSMVAQFEHTILITDAEARILTIF